MNQEERDMRNEVMEILERGPRKRWHETHGMRSRVGACIVLTAVPVQWIEGKLFDAFGDTWLFQRVSMLGQRIIRYADQRYAMDYDLTNDERGALVELHTDGRWYVRTWIEGVDDSNDMPVVQSTYGGDYIGAYEFAAKWVNGE